MTKGLLIYAHYDSTRRLYGCLLDVLNIRVDDHLFIRPLKTGRIISWPSVRPTLIRGLQRTRTETSHTIFARLCPFEIFLTKIVSAL